jgi:3'-5' exoribonuclease
MAHKFIVEIEPGQTVNDVYLVKEPILRSTARGDLYIAMYICDRTGQLNGRMWQATEAVYNALPKPGFVHIDGRSEIYQNNLQIVINNVSVVDPSKVNPEDFLARTDKDTKQLFKEVKEILAKIQNGQLKALIQEFLADTAMMENFCKSPAAAKLHHSYLGGLLEHTHNMLRVAMQIFPFYPKVQADLVLAAIFIHDMGKTEELSCDMAFSYTDTGQLIGHITKSFMMMNAKAESLAAKGTEIDHSLLDSLGHIILSHHGQYEFGSPKLPATPEAFMVNYIDDLDAKLNQVTGLIDNEPGDATWTNWQNSLGTKLYRKRVE